MPDASRPALAYHLTEGAGPPVLFLPGYASDMTGAKALALEAWARANGRRFLRFDYGGCGASEGRFEEQTLTGWRDDALAMLELLGEPAILVGSSMGGWIMLLIARPYPEKVAGLVGVAPAPDFTDWGFTPEEKAGLIRDGRIARPSPYAPEPTITTARFFQSGEASRMMHAMIAIDRPTRLIQGQRDTDVPWNRTAYLATLLTGNDVQTWLVKDGDHRLSRPEDIALMIRAVEDVTTRIKITE